MTTGESISAPHPPQPDRRRPWTRLVVVLVLAATATVSGWAWWWSRQPAQRFARALAALDAKRFDEVRRELDALEQAPNHVTQRHFLRGAMLLQGGRFFPALDEFGNTVNDPELRQRTLLLSGQALYHVQDFCAVIGLLLQAVNTDPDSVDAHRWLAAAYYDLGLNNDAMQHLVRVAELAPTDARPHRLMGLIQKDFENFSVAIDSYGESLRRNPQQPDREAILQELAECQIKLRQYDEALATLAQAQPSPDRWALEAESQFGVNHVVEARRLLDQTLQAAPANLRALVLQATIALEQGDAAAAVQVLSQAVAGYPKDYTVRFKLERAYRRMGDSQHADEQAGIASEIKRVREQFSNLHETAAAEPRNADVRCQLGVLAQQLDRPDLARVWFQAALAIDPRHAETLRQISTRQSK